MQQFFYASCFIVFSSGTRSVKAKIILYGLIATLVTLVVMQIVLHVIPSAHMSAVLADSDPWNG